MILDGARLFHVNVNCSDLERSREFWTDGIGLEVHAHVAPDAPASGEAFGLGDVRGDAYLLGSATGARVDLVRWLEPEPVALRPAGFATAGFQRIGVMVPDLDAAIAKVGKLGARPWREEPMVHELDGGGVIKLAVVSDPDGAPIELIEGATTPNVGIVGVCCADLERSVAWYRALGFSELGRFPGVGDDGTHLGIAGPFDMLEVLLAPPAGGDATLMLVGFAQPAVQPLAPKPAHGLGIARLAFSVDDVAAAHAALVAGGVAPMSAPVVQPLGPGQDPLRLVCLRGPDGELLELIQRPPLAPRA